MTKHVALIYLEIVVLTISLLTLKTNVCAKTLQWTELHRKWMLALTYKDEDPEDFGAEVSGNDKLLLERFRPHIMVSPHGLLPVDFYDFYLPNTVVRDIASAGQIIKTGPDRNYLKSIERNERYYLDYDGPMIPCSDCRNYVATGYGRVYREVARLKTKDGTVRFPITILKYNFVFPYSGLPAVLGSLKEITSKLFADPVRFHELDIHGAVHLILDSNKRPLILLLAQHNSFRSYLIGKEVKRPEGNRVSICFAERSNEPYPCPSGPQPALHRAAGNPVYTPFIIDGRSPPLMSGEDRVHGSDSGAVEVNYKLKFLPDRDPLYVSWISLGNRGRVLFFNTFYRNGPPGIDMNTWPELKNYGDIMQFWYFRENHSIDADIMEQGLRSFTDVDFESILQHNGQRLYEEMLKQGYIK